MKTYSSKALLLLLSLCFLFTVGVFGGNNTSKDDNNTFSSGRIGKNDLLIELPSTILKGKSEEIKISFKNLKHNRLRDGKGIVTLIVNGVPHTVTFENGKAVLNHIFNEPGITIYADDFLFEDQVHFTTFWIFLLPVIILIIIFIGIRFRKRKAGER